MAPLRCECSVLVVLMVDQADGVSVFEVLKRCGVRPADHLTAVQLLVGAKFDVILHLDQTIKSNVTRGQVLDGGPRGFTEKC